MINIDINKCIGCELCVKDCFMGNLTIRNNKAKAITSNCFLCGHCVAICPQNAVDIDDLDMSEVVPVSQNIMSPNELLTMIKSRRSTRKFNDKQIEQDKILNMIEAGRFTPTGGNQQGLSYIVIKDEIPKFRTLIIESLGKKGKALVGQENIPANIQRYAKMWVGMAKAFEKNPDFNEGLFFGAPSVILIAGNSKIDAGLAASNMELMALSQGLGLLYSGFIAAGCEDETVRDFLGLNKDCEVLIALVVGYTDIKYQRTVPRKKPSIHWK